MQRSPTVWQSNPDKQSGVVAYSDSATAYSSSTVAYSNANAALDENDKDPAQWTPETKDAAVWDPNPAAAASHYAYDSAAHLYDSATDTYDGIVTGENPLNDKDPAQWSNL